METVVIRGDDLAYAAQTLLRGGLVGVPTETVYGLGCNGLDAEAVARVYDVKGRPAVKPLSLLVPDIVAAEAFCSVIPEDARLLAGAYWPGPLTMILPCRGNVPEIVTAGGDTIGIRCPDHPKTIRLMELAGIPIAAPSANPSDMPAPKSAEDVLAYFGGMIECVIDGGICALGVESTIIDLTARPYRIIRRGALSEAEIARVVELKVESGKLKVE